MKVLIALNPALMEQHWVSKWKLGGRPARNMRNDMVLSPLIGAFI